MMCRLNFDEPHMVVTENKTLNTCNHVFVTSDIIFKDEGVRPQSMPRHRSWTVALRWLLWWSTWGSASSSLRTWGWGQFLWSNGIRIRMCPWWTMGKFILPYCAFQVLIQLKHQQKYRRNNTEHFLVDTGLRTTDAQCCFDCKVHQKHSTPRHSISIMWESMGRWYYPRWCLHLMSITHETPLCSIIQLNFTVFARGSETDHCPAARLRITVLLAIVGFGLGKSATGSDFFLNHLTEVIKPRIFVSFVITWSFEVLACWHGSTKRFLRFAAVLFFHILCIMSWWSCLCCAARLTTYVICYTMFVFAAAVAAATAVAAVVIVVVGIYSVLESRTLKLCPGIQDLNVYQFDENMIRASNSPLLFCVFLQ